MEPLKLQPRQWRLSPPRVPEGSLAQPPPRPVRECPERVAPVTLRVALDVHRSVPQLVQLPLLAEVPPPECVEEVTTRPEQFRLPLRARHQKLPEELEHPSHLAQHKLLPPRLDVVSHLPLLHDPRQAVRVPLRQRPRLRLPRLRPPTRRLDEQVKPLPVPRRLLYPPAEQPQRELQQDHLAALPP